MFKRNLLVLGNGLGFGVGITVEAPGTGARVTCGAGVVQSGLSQQGFMGSRTIVQYTGRPG